MNVFMDLMWYFKQEKRRYLTGIALLALVSLCLLVPPKIIGYTVDRIKSNSLTGKQLGSYMLILALVAVIVYLLRFFWRVLIYGASIQLALLLRNRLYTHFTNMSPRFYQKKRVGDLMAHSTNDLQAIQQTAGDGVLTLVDSSMMGGFTLITMAATISWKLTLISLLPLPVMAWSTSRYGSMLHERFHKAQEAFSEMNDKVQESISGARVIKAFGQEEQDVDAFKALSKDVVQKNISVAKVDALFDPTISLVVGVSFFLAVSYGSSLVINGELTIGQLVSFTSYLGLLIWPMLAFGWLFNIVERGRASYDRVTDLLKVNDVISEKEDGLQEPPAGSIEMKLTSFSYDENGPAALKDIYFELAAGKTMGIVGKTGSGKTTLCRLLLKEFQVGDHQIILAGHDINDYRLHAVREAIGYVPQDHFLFSATVAENIAFGKYHASFQEIKQASKDAAVYEDIVQFKDEFETVVGERGVTLSGGQKQRISIARALLTDPELLILDDSLSAVDARTEENILKNLKGKRKDKTTIITAHRLSSVDHADLIIVLDEGRIIQKGIHEELIAIPGWYRDTYESQALESLIAKGG
ncbi:multidrug ABC transporter ATP-binding protein [Fictibacillus enclensis]|uniref:Multidrug ABC transporter ATP-binding protein n=1 Tax=Fictibacillus enclensis TaxID=1017270 RepID=A0A0V8JFX2_9BACL|nr:ABC transporter transmembrane domain-containing protein [Fictibacillus enclensis]KSU85990.1 multidrug ABC transporter ATP-binding protein [Fictibacillus enclensis]